MAAKHIISPGIGFSPGSVKYIVGRGLIPSQAVTVVRTIDLVGQRNTTIGLTGQRNTTVGLTGQRNTTIDLEGQT